MSGGDGTMPLGNARADVKEELSKLKFENKNQSMAKLPSNMTVERRPLIHAPIASPFAGSSVQKVVYISRNTPIMSAVKRVKKLLLHVEKRAMQSVDLMKDKNGMRTLAEANEKLGKNGEKVLVKASGRAMEQALRVGEWFRNREDELACNVEVQTGSVQAVDDIVEKEPDDTVSEGQSGEAEAEALPTGIHDASLFTTGDHPKVSSQPVKISGVGNDSAQQTAEHDAPEDTGKAAGEQQDKKRRRRGKRKREMFDEDTTARIRWVKTVEVAISLRS